MQKFFYGIRRKRDNIDLLFQERITNLIETIQKNLGIYQIRYRDVRIAFMRKIPFGVHYRIFDRKIIIIGIYYTSRDPSNWDR